MGGFGGGTCVFGVGPFLMPAGAAGACPGDGATPLEGGTGGSTPAATGVVVGVVVDAVDAVPAAVLGSRGASVGVTFWLAATFASRSFSLRSSS